MLGSDPAYLQSVFGFLLQQQLDALTLQVARDLLAQAPPKSERQAIIALAAASACYFRGNYDQAEDFLSASAAGVSYDFRLLHAQINWERGYRELALFNLRALAQQFPRHESAAIQLGAWLRELGRNDEFRRLSLLRQIANPEGYAARVDLLYALHQDHDEVRLARESEAALGDFSRNHAALVALADFAANTGDSALAARIYAHCRAQNLPWEAPAFLAVESLVVKKDYRAALQLTGDLLRDHPDWAKRYYALFNSLQAVAYYRLGDPASAQLYLANFLGQADLRADNLLAVARRFTEVGARAQARQVLAQAAAADPLNQASLTGLVRLDLETENLTSLPDSLRRLVAMRKPSVELLRTAQRKLGSDLLLFSPGRDESLRQLHVALAAAGGTPRLPR